MKREEIKPVPLSDLIKDTLTKSPANRHYPIGSNVPSELANALRTIYSLAYLLRDRLDAIEKLPLLTRDQADKLYGREAVQGILQSSGFQNPLQTPNPNIPGNPNP